MFLVNGYVFVICVREKRDCQYIACIDGQGLLLTSSLDEAIKFQTADAADRMISILEWDLIDCSGVTIDYVVKAARWSES